jgi:pyruvate/2-oxoglutarate dehydrogenase complex dihydrolipoamide acyltransferase (E2) component
MKAKAKKPHGTIRAFTGREFVAYEWRPVPAGSEDEAGRLEAGGYLELKREPPPAIPARKVKARINELKASSVLEVNATTSARAMASSLGVDLATVEGTGVGGRILISDIERMLSEEEE